VIAFETNAPNTIEWACLDKNTRSCAQQKVSHVNVLAKFGEVGLQNDVESIGYPYLIPIVADFSAETLRLIWVRRCQNIRQHIIIAYHLTQMIMDTFVAHHYRKIASNKAAISSKPINIKKAPASFRP